MTDIKTVVNGLNDIGGFIAGRVGFEQARDFLRTIDDAIALLKEQEKPIGKCVNECECWDSAYERGKQDALKEQEAVEPVKLVRCKNCKHCDSERIDKNMIWCKIHQFGRPDDYYCADGIEK